tara:strand:- start:72 stop:467 length:396 start_codon:yes stop_codon:yes gene_type:complete
MRCKLCNKKSEHLELHHIIPKSRGGLDDKSNLIKLCSKCHGLAHNVSFKNERGGLIKEGVERKKEKNEQGVVWLEENEELVNEKMDKLYEKDEDTFNLMLILLEQNRIQAEHLMDWCNKGSFKLKTVFTFR